jgi:hypothetical protein
MGNIEKRHEFDEVEVGIFRSQFIVLGGEVVSALNLAPRALWVRPRDPGIIQVTFPDLVDTGSSGLAFSCSGVIYPMGQ